MTRQFHVSLIYDSMNNSQIFWFLTLIRVGSLYLCLEIMLCSESMNIVTDEQFSFLIKFVRLLWTPRDTKSSLLSTVTSDLRFLFMFSWLERVIPVWKRKLITWFIFFFSLNCGLRNDITRVESRLRDI